jgi:DNA-binding response OmpR family regulator
MEDTKPTINVLAVSAAAEDQVSLRAIFTHSRWRLSEAASCADAISLLTADPVPILIVNAILPDATWRDLLTRVSALPNPPLLIVASHLADDQLWAEALNLGAHDVLDKPFRAREVFQSVSMAWRRWNDLSAGAHSTAMFAVG